MIILQNQLNFLNFHISRIHVCLTWREIKSGVPQKRRRRRRKGRKGEEARQGLDQRWREADRLVRSPPGGAPRWPVLARRDTDEDRANRVLWMRRRPNETRKDPKKHGGFAPREDLPNTGPERLDCSTSLSMVPGKTSAHNFSVTSVFMKYNFFNAYKLIFLIILF